MPRCGSLSWVLTGLVGLGVTAAPAGHAQSAPAEGQQVVLVTGSTSGLGREVARRLASDGAHVIVHGRNRERTTRGFEVGQLLRIYDRDNSDYVIVTEDVEASFARVEAILVAERLKRDRQAGLGDFVRGMGIGQ